MEPFQLDLRRRARSEDRAPADSSERRGTRESDRREQFQRILGAITTPPGAIDTLLHYRR